MARSGEERLRELRMAVEQQNADLKLEIDSKASEVKRAVAVDREEGQREEERALLRKKRVEDANKQTGTWSYGWIASIVFGCAAVAVLICLFLFGGTPMEAKVAKRAIIAEERNWELQVEETYGDAACPRPDKFPIECHGKKWLDHLDRCTSVFLYRGWDVDFLKDCGLIKPGIGGRLRRAS